MNINIGVLCSEGDLELAAAIAAARAGRLPGEVKIVVADRGGEALALAREAGFYGVFIPRTAFHANRDGYERRLVEILRQAEVRALVLAGFRREIGPVLNQAFPNLIFGPYERPEDLENDLNKNLRARLFRVAS